MISYIDFDKITNSFINKEYLEKEFQNNPYAKCLIYEENNQVLGYLYYSDIYDRIEINQIEVEESNRSKGIGSKLLEYLLKEDKNITLEVKETNDIAINLYKKYGFKEVAKRDKYYQGIDGILMERK
ncbi:MAG: GNAT family N-acetyltransferase [Bacilli bacterium]|nr:GNAT family N-acetyltransferase [Bacilli bacterium]